MDGVGACVLCRGYDGSDIQIGGGPGARKGGRIVRAPDMKRFRIVFGIDGGCLQAGLGGRSGNADRDLPAIGDQDMRKGFLHGHWLALHLGGRPRLI